MGVDLADVVRCRVYLEGRRHLAQALSSFLPGSVEVRGDVAHVAAPLEAVRALAAHCAEPTPSADSLTCLQALCEDEARAAHLLDEDGEKLALILRHDATRRLLWTLVRHVGASPLLARCAPHLREALEEGDDRDSLWALHGLALLPWPTLATHTLPVLATLEHASAEVRRAALRTLEALPPDVCAHHARRIDGCFEDSAAEVRHDALRVVARMPVTVLAPRAARLRTMAQTDACGLVRGAAAQLCARLECVVG